MQCIGQTKIANRMVLMRSSDVNTHIIQFTTLSIYFPRLWTNNNNTGPNHRLVMNTVIHLWVQFVLELSASFTCFYCQLKTESFGRACGDTRSGICYYQKYQKLAKFLASKIWTKFMQVSGTKKFQNKTDQSNHTIVFWKYLVPETCMNLLYMQETYASSRIRFVSVCHPITYYNTIMDSFPTRMTDCCTKASTDINLFLLFPQTEIIGSICAYIGMNIPHH